MDEFKTVITSEEKSVGKSFYIAAIVLIVATFGFIFSSIQSASGGAAFGGFLSFIFALTFYVIGSFKNKKYKQLGETPLTLIPSYCSTGSKTNGSILIKRKQFNRVKELSLICWKARDSSGDGTSCWDIVWETTIIPNIEFSKSRTMLNFEFTIPEGTTPTDERFLSTNKYHWEIGFEFVEKMDALKRTWKIPVKTQ